MNDNAKKWVAALRSGEFKQNTRTLRVEDNYCCLGVACELYRRETGKGEWHPGEIFAFVVDHVVVEVTLPQVVACWMGLNTRDGRMNNNDTLVYLNDEGNGFDEIAAIIESEPEGLFVKENA